MGSYKLMFQAGQLIEHKQTGTRAVIVEVNPHVSSGRRSGYNYSPSIRYYLFYVPQNPAYNHQILQEGTTMMAEYYRVIT